MTKTVPFTFSLELFIFYYIYWHCLSILARLDEKKYPLNIFAVMLWSRDIRDHSKKEAVMISITARCRDYHGYGDNSYRRYNNGRKTWQICSRIIFRQQSPFF